MWTLIHNMAGIRSCLHNWASYWHHQFFRSGDVSGRLVAVDTLSPQSMEEACAGHNDNVVSALCWAGIFLQFLKYLSGVLRACSLHYFLSSPDMSKHPEVPTPTLPNPYTAALLLPRAAQTLHPCLAKFRSSWTPLSVHPCLAAPLCCPALAMQPMCCAGAASAHGWGG